MGRNDSSQVNESFIEQMLANAMYVDMSDQYSVIEQFLFITRFSLRAPAVVYRALALSTPASASYTPHTTVGALCVWLE